MRIFHGSSSVAADALQKNLFARSQFTITPGSEQIRAIAERDGYLKVFEKLGGTLIIRHGEGHMGSTLFNQPYRKFPLLEKLLSLERV
jgi:hypothetical protein